MKAAVSVLAALAALAGCAAHVSSEYPEVVRPSDVNAAPLDYEGRDIHVKGHLVLRSDGHNLYQSKALKNEFGSRIRAGERFDTGEYAKYCLTVLANPRMQI